MKCELIVYPELALTSFFPRWWMEDREEIDSFFEHEMPGPDTRALFDEAQRLRMGFYLGYAERRSRTTRSHHYNTSIIVDRDGRIVGKYRKIHLPGHADHRPNYPFQHLEKRYFDVGNLGFGAWRAFDGVVGMCICNDRRWPETYRVIGLAGGRDGDARLQHADPRAMDAGVRPSDRLSQSLWYCNRAPIRTARSWSAWRRREWRRDANWRAAVALSRPLERLSLRP